MVNAGLVRARTTWDIEPRPVGEERWTPGAAGWGAWNGKSPEVEFVEFVGALAALARPRRVVETGVGQGYTTRRILRALPADGHLALYESDPEFRVVLADVIGGRGDPRVTVAPAETPATFADVDLAVLDSRTGLRVAELALWGQTAPAGSICIVHDVSSAHPEGTIHRRLAAATAAVERTPAVTGFCLPNPRGSWIGRRT
jgi:predicted O-methyltransferase YrrM